MKLRRILLALLVGVAACQPAEDTFSPFTVTVSNPLNIDREAAFVHIPVRELPADFLPGAFVVKNGDQEIPSQFIKKGKAGLAFVVDLDAEEEKQFTVSYSSKPTTYPKKTQAEISVKTGGKFENRKYIGGDFKNIDSLKVPDEHTDHSYYIRYEGPGWESDKVGYRFYLDWRNATDVFGKTTNEPVLQQVGLDGFDSYHEMQDWGMDVLKVGKSLGIGSVASFVDSVAQRVAETDSVICKIEENGAIYSSFETTYFGWKIHDQSVKLTSDISIHAGTRLTRQKLHIDQSIDNLCTGINKIEGTEIFRTIGSKNHYGYIATYGAQSLNGDNLGMVVFFHPLQFARFDEDENSHIVVLQPHVGDLEYYFAAAWELEPNGITTAEEFDAYIRQMAAQLAQPVNVKIEKS
ncbi:DUF4861 domain-containing protein [Reichenbachiella ulvae]|uniref:DUF4861 domain-containing protein n=1 Tax=Reichenbachiella ulvae TaxID=2980104 RepID=A0ABT3CYQ8_9BACT|nr:DUF4861 domain-containing protein [Reichenbachiella ulvae]MCV9388835.1 DUF4861 domain-containing protein [Reichenbachiella ulvae]